MSVKNSAYLAAAANRVGVTYSGDLVVNSMLNDVAVTGCKIIEADGNGKAVMVVVSDGKVCPVVNSNGDVQVFANAGAAMRVARASNLPDKGAVSVYKFAKVSAIGDPVAGLKVAHRSAKAEEQRATDSIAVLAKKITAAVSLHWDTAADGSAEKAEYDDMTQRKAALDRWLAVISTKRKSLEAGLVAAGIDPVTYLPKPANVTGSGSGVVGN